jgi:hypothetical protein
VLLRFEAQRVRRPTPPAKRHRHVGGVGALGHGEACAAPSAYPRILGDDDAAFDSPLRMVVSTGASNRRLEINHRMEWEPGPGEPARLS